MSLQPQLPNTSLGSFRGVAQAIGDIRRDIRALKVKVGQIHGTISGTQITPGSITGGPGGNIATLTVTGTNIVLGTVTGDKIPANAITGVHIGTHQISAAHIVAGTITANEIMARTIVANNIQSRTITANEITSRSITANEITAGTITANEVAARTILANNIVSHTITANEITAGTITSNEIAASTIIGGNIFAGTITALQIAAFTITAGKIAANTITAAQIAAGTITATEITAGTITATQIAANTITAAKIAAGTITATQISAGTITATQISAGTITSANIAAGTITATNIAAATITGSLIASATITSTNLASGSVTATQINVSSLSAVSGTMGTVTGGIFQTNTSGARVMMGSGLTTPTGVTAGIIGIDGSNNVTFSVDATTGNVVLKGTLQQGSSGLGNIDGVTQNALLLIGAGNLIANSSGDSAPGAEFTTGLSNCTIAQDAVLYLTAGDSFKVTTTANGAWAFHPGNSIAMTPAQVISMALYVYTATARTLTLSFAFYSSTPTLLSTASTTVTTLAGQWKRVAFENQVAPASTASVTPGVAETAGVAGATLNFDDIVVSKSPNAQGAQIIAGSITATQIAAGTITATQIAANTITAGNIATGTLTATQIAAGSITADRMSVTALDAISANLGVITSGSITGATIQTATFGSSRTVLDTTGVWCSDSSGFTKLIGLDATNGLRLTAGSGAINSIEFMDTVAGSTVRAQIYSLHSGTNTYLVNYVYGATGNSYTSITTDSSVVANNRFEVGVYNPVGGVTPRALLYDANGRSSFLQIGTGAGTGAGKYSATGSGTFTWTGGTQTSVVNNITLPNATSAVSGIVQAGTLSDGGGTVVTQVTPGVGYVAAVAQPRAVYNPAAGTTASLYYFIWEA